MVVRRFCAVVAVVVLSACSASLDTRLDGKRCRLTHRCLSGYTCSVAGFCERSRDAGPLSEAGQDDGEDSGMAEMVDASRRMQATKDAEPPDSTAPQSQPEAGSTTPTRESPQNVPTRADAPADPPAPPSADPPAQDPPSVNPSVPDPREPSPPPRMNPPKDRPSGAQPPRPPAGRPPAAMADECGPGLTRCGSNCVDLEREASSCGACDRACSIDETCSAGKCVPARTQGPD
jgi:Stigma-specific protein, Stig1